MPDKPDDVDVEALALMYLDGTLEPAMLPSLDRALDDEESRRRFVRVCWRTQILRERMAQRPIPSRIEVPEKPSPRSRLRGRRAMLAGALAASLAAGFLLARVRSPRPTESAAASAQRFALLTAVGRARWQPGGAWLAPGTFVGGGQIEVVEGVTELDFLSGAKLRLPAPARLEVLSASGARLIEGAAAARATPAGIGFHLDAPGTTVVDMGTEFHVRVDASGRSTVAVDEGTVEASLLGDDGATFTSAVLNTADVAALDTRGHTLTTFALPPGQREPTLVHGPPPLVIPAAYVARVKSDRPVAYWRFEDAPGGRLRNEMAPHHAARMVGAVTLHGDAHNRFALFTGGHDDGMIAVDDPFDQLAPGDYTIELWFAAEAFQRADLAVLVPPVLPGVERHFALVELEALPKGMAHPAAAVRFLHRWIPGDKLGLNGKGGVNAFSPEPYHPGRWYHLASVKRGPAITLYLDGVAVRSVPAGDAPSRLPVTMLMGRRLVETKDDLRLFTGSLDEVAVYDRGLSPEEIERHVAAARGGVR